MAPHRGTSPPAAILAQSGSSFGNAVSVAASTVGRPSLFQVSTYGVESESSFPSLVSSDPTVSEPFAPKQTRGESNLEQLCRFLSTREDYFQYFLTYGGHSCGETWTSVTAEAANESVPDSISSPPVDRHVIRSRPDPAILFGTTDQLRGRPLSLQRTS